MRFTDRGDGDLAVDLDTPALARRRAALVDLPWVWLSQVHGTDVVTVTAATAESVAGSSADALVTADAGVVLAVHTADCVPVLLVAREGAVGAVHAGWRGLADGVVGKAVEALGRLGARSVAAVIGPHIRSECYEFGAGDLERVAQRFGTAVVGVTGDGRPALDLSATARAALVACGVDRIDDVGICTSCDAAYHSHRARRDRGRQASVVWIEAL